jgi:nicotinamidase/pyrazinamidase
MAKQDVLIVTDIQNDFCPGGALAVRDGDAVVPLVNNIMENFYRVVATQDWHPKHQVSFASNHPGKKPYDVIKLGNVEQVLWPDHCVAGTPGADFHPGLQTEKFHLVVRKGVNPAVDSYSTFLENDKKLKTGLDGYLKSMGAERVFLVGLATDYCVFYSAMDSRGFGFDTYVIIDACRGIDVPEHNIEHSIQAMKEKGIHVVSSEDL